MTNPDCVATETSWNIEILPVVSFLKVNNADQIGQLCRLVWTFVVGMQQKQFFHENPNYLFVCLCDLILNIPVNKFSVLSGWVFLLSKDLCVLLKDTRQ